MTFAAAMFNRPDLDQSRQALALYVEGILPRAAPSLAYEGRLQIHNAVGDCTVKLLSGNLPPGATLSVDQATKEVVLTWPAYAEQAGPIQNPGFEDGAVGWDFGAGWSVTTDNPIAGARSAAYDNNHGDSLIESRSWLPTNVGDVVNASCAVRQGASSSGNAGGAVQLQYRNAAGQVILTVDGNPITQGSNNVVRTSNVMGVTPAEAVTINIAGRGIRKRQNRRVWMDSFAWDHTVPAVGINIDSQVCLQLQVDDSAGRSAEWAGCFLVTLWDYTWTSFSGGSSVYLYGACAHSTDDLAVSTHQGYAGFLKYQSTGVVTVVPVAALTTSVCAIAHSPTLNRWVFSTFQSFSGSAGKAIWSDDLVTFTEGSYSGVTPAGGGVCWSPKHNKFFVVSPLRWMESADGKVWTAANLTGPGVGYIQVMIWCAGIEKFVAIDRSVSGTPRFVYSADHPGGPWSSVSLANMGVEHSVAWSPSLHRLVTMGGGANAAYYSDDLINFQSCIFDPAITSLPNFSGIYAVEWSPSIAMFVASVRATGFTLNKRFIYSRDGRTWSLATPWVWDDAANSNTARWCVWVPGIERFLMIGQGAAPQFAYSNT